MKNLRKLTRREIIDFIFMIRKVIGKTPYFIMNETTKELLKDSVISKLALINNNLDDWEILIKLDSKIIYDAELEGDYSWLKHVYNQTKNPKYLDSEGLAEK